MGACSLELAAADGAKTSLIGLTRAGLKEALTAFGLAEREATLRARQLFHWLYWQGATDFAVMTTLGKPLRARLDEAFTLARPEIVSAQHSADGTIKWLIRFSPGVEAETVYIPEKDRGTLCVSSQVGCTLNCRFCHTGTQRLVRNLSAGEIVAQLLIARDALGEWPTPQEGRKLTNIVFMGMGEPLYNFEAVRDAVEIIADGEGLSIGKRRITVSTAGVVPMIERLGYEVGAMLAISLHATRDSLRDELVPLNKKYPLKELHRGLPQLSRPFQCAAHHFRICDAQRRERQPARRQGAGQALERHSGENQSHPVQSLARRAL